METPPVTSPNGPARRTSARSGPESARARGSRDLTYRRALRAAVRWLLGLLVTAASVAAARVPSPPNIVLIVADDLGYGGLSCYGNTEYRTPHLDRLASEGVRLTNFQVTTSGCAPSRAALLTGRYHFRAGIIRNPDPDFGLNEIGIPEDEVLLSESLKRAGYATACIGKWHLGHLPRFYPRRHGFDEYYGVPYSNSSRPALLVENERVVEYPVVQANLTKECTDRALRFLGRNAERPFFLYLPYSMPHYPLAASEEFFTPETPDDLYADVIRELDHSVGRILGKLDELGIAGRTLVIFTSDNGPWYGGSTAGLRGMKGSAFEGGIRVPLIARWTGSLPPGVTRHQPCGSIDLFPTLLAFAGAKLPPPRVLDGVDIQGVLRDDARLPDRPLSSLLGNRVATVRRGRWKLHVLPPGFPNWTEETFRPFRPDGVTILAPTEQYPGTAFPGVRTGDAPRPRMLFDLASDPAEQHDVAAVHPEIVQQLMTDAEALGAQIPPDLVMPAPLPFRRVQGPGRITRDRPRPLEQVLGGDARPER